MGGWNLERARVCAKAKTKEKAEITRMDTKASKSERAWTKARVREKVNAFQKSEAEASQEKGKNLILQLGGSGGCFQNQV